MTGENPSDGGGEFAALRELKSNEVLTALKQLYRYAQVGRCVSSVTHDVNNLLGAVLAYAELVQLDTQLSDESRRMLGEVMEAARRCSSLVNNLTSVARKERLDITLIEPAALVTHILDLRRYDLKVARISLEEEYEKGIPSLVVLKPRLEQAIIYLMSNAVEALENSAERRVRVQLKAREGWVDIEVWNSGPPVPESDREAIFLPFFSAKGGGHLGLGLHLAQEIVKLHEGNLIYDPSRGFVIELPRANSLAKSAQDSPGNSA